MMTNPLLEIKYKTQKQLYEEAQHDIGKYIANSHRIVRSVEAQYGVKFTYGAWQGGAIEPAIERTPISTHEHATGAWREPHD